MVVAKAFDVNKFGCTITPSNIIVKYGDMVANRFKEEIGDTRFYELRNLFREGRYQDLVGQVQILGQLRQKQVDGGELRGNAFYVDDEPIESEILNEYLVEYDTLGYPIEALVAFARRIRRNPDIVVVQDLFGCLEANKHPILPDGRFLAYKGVGKDSDGNLYDHYTGKLRNNAGDIVEMPRYKVNADRTKTCSAGLHIASFDYANRYYCSHKSNGVIIEVAVDPADVVAIPESYSSSKMRCCRYEVTAVNEGGKYDKLYIEYNG